MAGSEAGMENLFYEADTKERQRQYRKESRKKKEIRKEGIKE